jgi:hypothetical protein
MVNNLHAVGLAAGAFSQGYALCAYQTMQSHLRDATALAASTSRASRPGGQPVLAASTKPAVEAAAAESAAQRPGLALATRAGRTSPLNDDAVRPSPVKIELSPSKEIVSAQPLSPAPTPCPAKSQVASLVLEETSARAISVRKRRYVRGATGSRKIIIIMDPGPVRSSCC